MVLHIMLIPIFGNKQKNLVLPPQFVINIAMLFSLWNFNSHLIKDSTVLDFISLWIYIMVASTSLPLNNAMANIIKFIISI